MTFKNLTELAESTGHNVGYNDPAKKEFIRLGRKFVKELLIELELAGIPNIENDYNKAGIAVSGEFTVRGLFSPSPDEGGFYLHLEISPLGSDFGFYRATKGLKDFSGGRNRSVTESILDPKALAKLLLSESMRTEASQLASK